MYLPTVGYSPHTLRWGGFAAAKTRATACVIYMYTHLFEVNARTCTYICTYYVYKIYMYIEITEDLCENYNDYFRYENYND